VVEEEVGEAQEEVVDWVYVRRIQIIGRFLLFQQMPVSAQN
jgi:hypothetical protein